MDCIDMMALKPISFRDAVMNTNPTNNSLESNWEEEEDIELWEGDVKKEVVDGVPSIDFSNRVYSLIEESMSKTVVVKLLCGKLTIMLWNKVCALWKPSMRFQIMDIENDYYLAKFESVQDYKKSLWMAIGEMGLVIKIDYQSDKGSRGQFARFFVQVDILKPLVSKLKIADQGDNLQGCPHPYVELGVDGCLWKPNGNGKFSIKTAYNSLVAMDDMSVNED
ncbi:hypothetical protein Gotri_020760 [Gossypium trilobum]|uniref:DUF4283 domain-containing protein n=1 Tax=Gossypium trilobum TaxID=34281 RepID=A0A7J9DAC6_9ROSI|nr:hypothetical protein [Gossypium trilobum]